MRLRFRRDACPTPGADSSAASPALSGTKRTLPAPQSRDAKVDASEKQKPRPEKKSAPGHASRFSPDSLPGDVRRTADGIFMIKPGEVLQFQVQGYCLDPDRPAPAAGEPMRFIPMSGLINFRLRRLFYKVLHTAGRQRRAYAADFQNVIWAIRTANSRQSAWGDALGSAEKRLLDDAMPGGAALLQQVRRTATGRESGGMGLAPIMPDVNYSADSSIHLRRLFNETPRGSLPHSAGLNFPCCRPGLPGGLKISAISRYAGRSPMPRTGLFFMTQRSGPWNRREKCSAKPCLRLLKDV